MKEETGPTLKDLFFAMLLVPAFVIIMLVSTALMPDCQNAETEADRERISRECM
jgi:hypothetical protein